MARTWMTAGLAYRGRRLLSAALAILIGVGFLTTSVVVLQTAVRSLEDAIAAGVRDADLVLTADPVEPLTTSTLDAAAELDGVATAGAEGMVFAQSGPDDYLLGVTTPTADLTLLEGRMPAATGEVLANPALAEAGHGVGTDLRLTVSSGEEGAGATSVVQVVGVADAGDTNPVSFGQGFLADDSTLREIDPALTYPSVRVDLAEGADPEAVRAELAALAPEGLVQTGPEAARDRVDAMTGQTAVMSAMLLGFGAVGLLTAAIVIANTFTITLAQRTGELALLRCVGATRAQVRRSVLLEAVLLGLVASAAGVLAGIGAGWGLLELGRRADLGMPLGTGLALSWVAVVVPVLVGVVVTVLASLWPVARATRVSPLAALRPVAEVGTARSRVGLRLALAVLLVGGGVALMVVAAMQRQVLVGVAGGLVSFVGVLVAAVLVVPAAVRLLAPGARLAGVPGRLAVSGAIRNPGRAAATSAALLVGVTLITMTSVGAASGQRTALGEIDQEYAVDLVAEAPPTTDTDEQSVRPTAVDGEIPGRLAAVDGVASAEAVGTAYLTLELDTDLGSAPTFGLDQDIAGEVLRSEELVSAIEPGILGMSDDDMVARDLQVGDRVTVSGAGGERELRVVELGFGYGRMTVHADDLAALAGDDLQEGAVLIRLSDDADLASTMVDLTEVTDDASLSLDGAAAMRAQIVQVLDIMVLVTTALLGVAVVIAVVGIANTLSLSVIERHREHALLRGMGLTRGQMRVMLVVEGVLLAVVSAGLGLLLGIGYAALGIQTILPEGTALDLAVPWGRVGMIVGVALVAGMLASVLPARRAARVSPAEGLAAA